MEEIVDIREAEPEREHQRFAMLVVALADARQIGICRLPKTVWESESFEAVRWRITKPCFKCTAIFARPDFMQRRLHYGVEVPAVSSKNAQRIRKDKARRSGGEIAEFRSSGNYEASFRGG